MTEPERIRMLEEENAVLREQLATAKLVSRAKCLLVQHRGLTEAEAHRYIEKTAMDGQETRAAVARRILREYEADNDPKEGRKA